VNAHHPIRTTALAVAWRSLHHLFTRPALLVPSMLFPLFFLTAFAGGLSAVAGVPGFDFPSGYTAFQYVFVLLQASAFGGVFTGFGTARDFESGFMRRLMVASPRREGIVLGYVLAAVVRAVVTICVITAVALLAGMEVDAGAVDLFGLYVLALLTNLAAVLWAVGAAMRVRTLQAGAAIQVPVFLLLFLAPVYVPLDLLEGWIGTVARFNPVTPLLEAGRALISGEPTGIAVAFTVAAGAIALFAGWAYRGLRAAERAAP
jgi:ABC-2 type transport system permease protein